MRLEGRRLILSEHDMDHIQGWIEDGSSMVQAIDEELYLAGRDDSEAFDEIVIPSSVLHHARQVKA